MAIDRKNQTYDGRAYQSFSITKSDTVENWCDAFYVGSGGDISIKLRDDDTAVTLKNVASGTVYPLAVKYIMSTSTTASDIVGFRVCHES